MEQGYLIDTNAAIDYLHNRLPFKANNLIDRNKINLSVISRMELLAWKKATPDQLNLLHSFINASNLFNLDENVILEGIEIRKNFRTKLPDAIIAATAIVHKFTLVTRNTADFKDIPGLIFMNPWN
jgi:tRNA(fMet)-specific endonuclease VapC